MAEGDSVWRLARRLDDALAGRVLARGELRVAAHGGADLAGRTVLGHDTHGKHLLTRLEGELTLHTHARLDGRWTVVRPGRRLPPRLQPGIRVVLQTLDGPTAYGLDLPVVQLVRTRDERSVTGHLGPDPLRTDFSAEVAVDRLRSDPSRAVKDALLDQTLIAGLGNLWANELCFLRGVYPWAQIGDVDVPALVALAARALRVSATVPGAYQVTTGDRRRGETHWVTGRAYRPCRRCGTTVQVVPGTQVSRRTWWCPHCQPDRTEPAGGVTGRAGAPATARRPR